jgi:[histone H3]-lysine36 N-dimethyltransferase SETMAR
LPKKSKKQRPSSGTHAIKIHHDNAKPHIHKDVSTYLESEGITIMPQPLYSPDLAPCDFWLFNKDDYKKTFDKWIERMKFCVNNHGNYFEHLMK